MIVITCSHCGRNLRVEPSLAGRQISCPACDNPITVPAGNAAHEATLESQPLCAGNPSAGGQSGATGNSRLPLGFKDQAQLAAFKAGLEELIGKTRVDGQPITALVQVTGASTTFYSNNPDTPEGHHWDSSGLGKSDYDIDVFSPELAAALLRSPKVAANEEILESGKRVFFRSGGEAGFFQAFPQFESLVRRWEQELGRAIDFRLKLDLTPIARLPEPPAIGPGPILLLWRQ